MTTTAKKETMEFQAEAKQLLQLMTHSLYSNKEIFLRELISNASDACDKLRFEAIANPDLLKTDTDLSIRVDFDEKKRLITISDNGIGMTREEVIENIGTIAKSGTKKFLEKMRMPISLVNLVSVFIPHLSLPIKSPSSPVKPVAMPKKAFAGHPKVKAHSASNPSIKTAVAPK